MVKNQEKRVAIVTGGGRGIGRAIALTLGDQQLNLAINYLHTRKGAMDVARKIETNGGQAIAIKADVSKSNDVTRLVESVLKRFHRIDYLVNNAGTIVRPGDWRLISERTWQRTIDVNLKGIFNCIRTVAPHMLDRRYGKIVNLTSTYGMMGAAGVIAYSAAKAGVINLTRSFAKELAPYICVNAVAPGNIDTEMTRSAGGKFIKGVIKSTPLKRLGKPEEVADAVSFLLSDKSDFITGHVLIVDGGHMLK